VANFLDDLFREAQNSPITINPSGVTNVPAEGAPLRASAPEAPKRHGIMGIVNGILETVGDVALTQLGLGPQFGPAHQQNRINKVLEGYQDDPEGAILNISKIDPNYGYKLAQLRQREELAAERNQLDADKAAVTKGKAELALADAAAKNYQKGVSIWSNMMGAIEDESSFNTIKPMLNGVKGTYGLGPEFVVPDKYNQALITPQAKMGMTANQQAIDYDRDTAQVEKARSNKAREATAEKNAEANLTRANKPPAAKKPTEADIVQGLIDLKDRGGKLTAGQENRINRYNKGKDNKYVVPVVPKEWLEGTN